MTGHRHDQDEQHRDDAGTVPPADPGTTPQVDPRAGANPGYDDANPRSRADVPRHQPDARGADFGKLPNPESGGLDRDPVVHPDPASDEP